MIKYIGIKKVLAEVETRDGKEGYLVQYVDNNKPNNKEFSLDREWLSKEAFESTYVKMDSMDFSSALLVLKRGYSVTRLGWCTDKISDECECEQLWLSLDKDTDEDNESYINLHTVNGTMQIRWLPTQIDLMADDYYIVAD